MKPKTKQDQNAETNSHEPKNHASDILRERNIEGWVKLMEIRKKLSNGNKKNSVEILSEMRR